MKKKIITAIFALIMCVSLSVTAFAYDLFYDTYKKAAEALHEKYPDISVEEFMDEFSQFLNEPLDQEKINEAIQNLVNRLTPTTDPNETTTKKAPSTTKEQTTKEPSTKRNDNNNTTAAPSFTIPSGLINNNNNNTTSPNAGGITIPQITEDPSVTQTVPVVSMYQQNSPNINNNKNTQTPAVSDTSTVSSKTIMAWVIIAIGVMLLVVSIVVIVMSSDRRSSASSRNRKRMRKNGAVRKDYVPFTETTMPEVTVNTAADLAAKKHLSAQANKSADYTAFFDDSTASALDSAVIVAAESASSYTGESAPDVDTSVAEKLLKKSAKTVRICEDCGTTVPEDMMFCPKCGTFMGIVSEPSEDNKENRSDKSDGIIPPHTTPVTAQ